MGSLKLHAPSSSPWAWTNLNICWKEVHCYLFDWGEKKWSSLMAWAALTQTDFPIVKTSLQYQSQTALTIWTYSSMLTSQGKEFFKIWDQRLKERYCYCNQLSFILFWRRIRVRATLGHIHIPCLEGIVSHLCFHRNRLKLSSLPLEMKEKIAFYS